jgi:hypothetical protein
VPSCLLLARVRQRKSYREHLRESGESRERDERQGLGQDQIDPAQLGADGKRDTQNRDPSRKELQNPAGIDTPTTRSPKGTEYPAPPSAWTSQYNALRSVRSSAMPGCAIVHNTEEAASRVSAVVKPPNKAMEVPAARTPRNCSRLTTEAVKIPRVPPRRTEETHTCEPPSDAPERTQQWCPPISRGREVWLASEDGDGIETTEEEERIRPRYDPERRTCMPDERRSRTGCGTHLVTGQDTSERRLPPRLGIAWDRLWNCARM